MIKYSHFQDIPQLLEGNYRIDVPIDHIVPTLERWQRFHKLELEPEFQRVHVWSEAQRSAFAEHVLRGGKNTIIRFNCPGWRSNRKSQPSDMMTVVDGKQRLSAILGFLDDKVPAFGNLCSEFEGEFPMTAQVQFLVNDLLTEAEVLQWYLEINEGNVAHTAEELERVRVMLRKVKQ